MAERLGLSARLERTIGAIVVSNGHLEHWVDLMVMALYLNLPGTKKLSKNKYPWVFTDEMEFMERCFKELPALRPARLQGLQLLTRIRAAHANRSDLVHGHLRYWNKETKRLAFMRVLKQRGSEAQMVVYSTSEAGLARDAKRVKALSEAVHQFALRLDNICRPPDGDGFLI